MEGRRMAGSGQDFIITSHSASGPAVRRSSAVRDFGLVPLARRGRRAHPSPACQTNVNEHVQRHETAASRLKHSSSRLSCLGKRQRRASGRAAATIHRRAPIAEIADDVVLRSRAAAFSCQSVSGSCKAVRRPSFRRNRSTR